MADREQITQPSLGSNELGTETNDTHLESGVSAGTDTQLHLAAKGRKKNKKNEKSSEKDNNNKSRIGEYAFPRAEDTDE
jgi:hypothetical protein